MQHVVVTGAGSRLGRRMLALLAQPGELAELVAVDDEALAADDLPGSARAVRLDLATDDLSAVLEGADTVIHLGFAPPTESGSTAATPSNVVGARRLFEAVTASSTVSSVVVLSSAVVYGAWPQNPVPLTEDSALKPNHGFGFAAQRAEIERLATELRRARPDVAVAALRAAATVAEDGEGWLAAALRASAVVGLDTDEPPRQFVHLDDLAEAVLLAANDRLDGAFNVAPDGWITGEVARELAGVPRLPVPDRVLSLLAAIAREMGLVHVPDGIEPYLRQPWVVANDRLKAAGWKPRFTNEQAFVVARQGSRWTEMSPKRRQEVALGVSGVLLAGVGAGVAMLLRRRRR